MKSLLVHFLYRIFRSIFMSLFNIFYRLSNCDDSRLSKSKSIEVCSIVFRHKLADADMTGPSDFTWAHQRFDNVRILEDPHWMLYTVDEKFAYFVFMPKPGYEYKVDVAPFVYMRQFVEAKSLAKCSLDTFCHYCDELPDHRGTVVYISSAARSGSTLMTQLLQATNQAMVLGEPDAFTALTNLMEQKEISGNECRRVLRAIFRWLCKFQRPNEPCIIKTQANCIHLVPLIKEVCPYVRHFFTFRKNTRHILKSSEKALRHGGNGDDVVRLWNISPRFARWLINLANQENPMLNRFPMKDCLDYATLLHLGPYQEFIKNQRLFDLPWVLYEDVAKNPRAALVPILELCDISSESIEDGMKAFGKDSQAGTVLSQDNLKDVECHELTEERITNIHKMCDQLQIPRLEF